MFKHKEIGGFKADLIVNEKGIVELKAVRALATAHEAQLINYLKAINIEVGLLLNFGRNRNLKDLYMIIKEKISVMISVDRRLNNTASALTKR